MKKLLVSATALCFAVSAWATVDVSVTTHTYGGEYAPENCCAIWVEKDDGTFVKTIAAWGGELYRWYLIGWMAKAPEADYELDAMTGASRSTHGTITVTWDLQNSAGTAVTNGTYNIIVEMTEINDQGPLDTLALTYDGASVNASKPDKAPFSGFQVVDSPTVTPPDETEKKVDDSGMCGGGSIMAMGLTFMVTGMHGSIRRRKKKKNDRSAS